MNNIGILDPEGKNNNPLTGKEYTEQYRKLGKIWSKFPAYETRDSIIDDIKNQQIILISSGTGSGKTVLVPKYVLHAFNYEGKIAITLPKQIIAESSAKFAAKTLDVELGKEVGYQYRGSPREMRNNETKLLYATDGTIVARLLNDPKLSEFDAVVIDEAHERKVQIDFLLYLLRETIKIRPDFKLIIMSATINIDIFSEYFKNHKFKAINIGGKTNYPIESIYLQKPIKYSEVLDKAFEIIIKIMGEDDPKQTGAHDILLFVTSKNEAFDMCKRVKAHLSKETKETCKLTCDGDLYCVEIFSGVSHKKKQLAIDQNLYKQQDIKYIRKLVIATPAAESSLTIAGLKYVVDSGYELNGSYDPDYRAKRLDRQLTTQAQIIQRKGRAGRTEAGICYHLYTETEFKNLEAYPLPDIRTSDISSECLRLLQKPAIRTTKKLTDILQNFIEPPRENYIKTALLILTQLGAIRSGEITKLGELMANIGGDTPSTSLALVLSKLYECSHEMSDLMGLLNVSNQDLNKVLVNPRTLVPNKLRGNREKYNRALRAIKDRYIKAKRKIKHKYGDHLSLIKILTTYKEKSIDPKKLNEWCYNMFLKCDTIKKALLYGDKNRRSIYRNMRNITAEDLDITKINTQDMSVELRISLCLAIAYRINTAVRVPGTKDIYRTQVSDNLRVKINQDSYVLMGISQPKDVIYGELFMMMGRSNLNIVSKIPKKIVKLLS